MHRHIFFALNSCDTLLLGIKEFPDSLFMLSLKTKYESDLRPEAETTEALTQQKVKVHM
jgi:hypothetical protein